MKPGFAVLNHNPKNKAQNGSTPTNLWKKFKTQLSAGKVMLMVWDAQDDIFCDFLEKQCTIDSQYYPDMLINNVKQATREKRCRSQRKVLFSCTIIHTAQLKLMARNHNPNVFLSRIFSTNVISIFFFTCYPPFHIIYGNM